MIFDLRFHAAREGGDNLAQRNPAIIGRHALVPIWLEAFRLQTPHRPFGQIAILKTSAAQHHAPLTNSFATATTASASALWNFADILPVATPFCTSDKIASIIGDQSKRVILEFGVRSEFGVLVGRASSRQVALRNPH
jgi:hypothetical protein